MSSPTSRYIMIGGFLGAGKTTAIASLAQQLTAQGLRVGLITNDQGQELVDTAMLRSKGFATEEIPGGCFCCRFNSLVDAAERLTEQTRPDIFIAEPVGSCTDLVATVTYPLRRIYGNQFTIAPLSVLIDPIRAQRVFGLSKGGNFSKKVLYIFHKQIEEADIAVISKADLLSSDALAELTETLQKHFPDKKILSISSRTQTDLAPWFNIIQSTEQTAREALQIDYDIYADGEALLGWLNATVQVTSKNERDANLLLQSIAQEVQQRLSSQNAEIAHFKMTFTPDSGLGDIAAISLVRNDFIPELSIVLEPPITSGQIIVNLRAEASPDTLAQALTSALDSVTQNSPGLTLIMDHLEKFRPGRPTPTHRDA